MDGDKVETTAPAGQAEPAQAWTTREGTPLQSLPGMRVESPPEHAALPSFCLSQPQPEALSPWYPTAHYDAESGACSEISDVDSISSSTGELFRSIVIPLASQQPAKKKSSLSPTPSFTFIDAKAAAAARKRTVTCCASKSVLKITLTFCVSFLLGMVLTVIYMEVFLWRRR